MDQIGLDEKRLMHSHCAKKGATVNPEQVFLLPCSGRKYLQRVHTVFKALQNGATEKNPPPLFIAVELVAVAEVVGGAAHVRPAPPFQFHLIWMQKKSSMHHQRSLGYRSLAYVCMHEGEGVAKTHMKHNGRLSHEEGMTLMPN